MTYYWSSKLFPKAMRQHVTQLYSFVRIADDYVDATPAQAAAFHDLRTCYERAFIDSHGDSPHAPTMNQRVARNMAQLVHQYQFDPAWVEAFLDAMASDLRFTSYVTLQDTLRYVYGSAEVIGLMMARLMQVPSEAHHAAQLQGRAMQWINFLRDVAEDTALGRLYFPQEVLQRYGVSDLQLATAQAHPDAFVQCMRDEVARYRAWQAEATRGYAYLSPSVRLPLSTATRLYAWTADRIAEDPWLVFRRQLKPSKLRIARAMLQSFLRLSVQ